MPKGGTSDSRVPRVADERRYLPEIDGLRAIAVVCVILYHSKISSFSNGYLGVDIFFVISGFVITRLIVNQGTSFSFREFYGRRIRRLAPSLFLMLFITEIVSVLLLYPSESRRILLSLLYITFFAGNVYFLKHTNYFTDSQFNPLLHTWSLGVEEQFYLLLPIFLFLLIKKFKNFSLSLLTVFAVGYISFLVALVQRDSHQSFAFYMLATRAWELLLGVAAALIVLKWRRNRKLFQLTALDSTIAISGIVLIMMSLFGLKAVGVFPDRSSILVCLGVFLLLLSSQPRWLYGAMSNPLLVAIGKRSYTAYLWHFPILGFFEYFLGHRLSISQLLYCYYFLIVITELVYRYIENPIRKKSWSLTKSVRLLSISMALVVCSSIYLLYFPVKSDSVGSEKGLLKTFVAQMYIERAGTCFVDLGQKFVDFPTSCDPNASQDSMVIIGDSHAAVFAEGLRARFKNVGEYTSSLCPPFVNIVRENRPNCKAVNDSAFAHIAKLQPDSIILSANWWYYAYGYSDKEMTDYLGASIDYLKSISPKSKILLFGGLPLWLPDMPTLILRSNIPFVDGAKLLNTNLDRIRKNDALVEAVALEKGVKFVSPMAHLCDLQDQCTVLLKKKNGEIEPYVYDAAHLTPEGSLDLIKKFQASGAL